MLGAPLAGALVADRCQQPFHRSLVRLPWRRNRDNVVRINVESFDRPPDEINETLARMSRYSHG